MWEGFAMNAPREKENAPRVSVLRAVDRRYLPINTPALST